MALINIETALGEAARYICKAPIGGGIEIMSYKRNRIVALIRVSDQSMLVREQGYVVGEVEIELEQLEKMLKPVFKREFPRSRKVRFFKFSDPAELDRAHQKI